LKDGARSAARWGLVLLTVVNFFNYLDRFVVSALVESLKKSELALSDRQLGSLASAFVIVYMLASPLFGVLGDRGKRPRLLAAGVALWSLATAAGGLARSFAALFAARAAVGIGEAAYGTIAPAMLADFYPRERRGRVFSIFFAAIAVGGAAGYIVGGLADQRFGWRAAFGIAGLPGVALALLCLTLRDPERGGMDRSPHPHPNPLLPGEGAEKTGWKTYGNLLRNRPYVLTVAGYAAYTFALGALAFWMPAFLERVRGVPRATATIQFGGIVVATGLIGTFAGGWLGDLFLRRSRQAYLRVSGWVTLAAAPATLVAFVAPQPAVYLPALVVAQLLVFASTGPINSAIVNVVAPAQRARAVGLSILAIHLFGDVPSPPLVGAISDATDLQRAFLILPAAFAAGGAIWLYAAWRGDR
jgi:MFS family permease